MIDIAVRFPPTLLILLTSTYQFISMFYITFFMNGVQGLSLPLLVSSDCPSVTSAYPRINCHEVSNRYFPSRPKRIPLTHPLKFLIYLPLEFPTFFSSTVYKNFYFSVAFTIFHVSDTQITTLLKKRFISAFLALTLTELTLKRSLFLSNT